MLRGDLARTPLPDVLLQLAGRRATGRLDVDGTASVHLHDGAVYAAGVAGRRASLAARLLSRGAVDARRPRRRPGLRPDDPAGPRGAARRPRSRRPPGRRRLPARAGPRRRRRARGPLGRRLVLHPARPDRRRRRPAARRARRCSPPSRTAAGVVGADRGGGRGPGRRPGARRRRHDAGRHAARPRRVVAAAPGRRRRGRSGELAQECGFTLFEAGTDRARAGRGGAGRPRRRPRRGRAPAASGLAARLAAALSPAEAGVDGARRRRRGPLGGAGGGRAGGRGAVQSARRRGGGCGEAAREAAAGG